MSPEDMTTPGSGDPDTGAFALPLDVQNPTLGPPRDLAALSQWELLEHALDLDLPGTRVIFVSGPPGIGKTYAAYNYGRLDKGYTACTLTDETSAADVRGHWVLKNSETRWHDGPFVTSMRQGNRLVVNELTHANEDVRAILYPILESPETAELKLPNGETIRPAPGFHVVCTDNYGVEELPEALADRFGSHFQVKQPHPKAIEALHPELRELAIATSALDDERRVSLRGWFNLQAAVDDFGLEAGCIVTFGPDRGPLVYEAVVMRRNRPADKRGSRRARKGTGKSKGK